MLGGVCASAIICNVHLIKSSYQKDHTQFPKIEKMYTGRHLNYQLTEKVEIYRAKKAKQANL